MEELLSSIRHSPDRWLHALRHRRAIAIARDRARAGALLLIVCHGNICRSPYAAAVLRRALQPLEVEVESAGLIGPGRPVPEHAAATALAHGEDLSAHRSRLVTAQLVSSAALIVVMDDAQRTRLIRTHVCDPSSIVLLGDFDPQAILKRSIRDPYSQGAVVFEEVFSRIDRCAAVLSGRRGTSNGAYNAA